MGLRRRRERGRIADGPPPSPAWLTEAAMQLFSWEAGEPGGGAWNRWLHGVGAPLEGAVEVSSYHSEVEEVEITVSRAMPTRSIVRDLTAHRRAAEGTRAVALLERGYLVYAGRPEMPVIVEAGAQWPRDAPREMRSARTAPIAVVVCWITDGHDDSVLVSPVDTAEGVAAGLLPPAPPGMEGRRGAANLTEIHGGVGVVNLQEFPMPWLNHVMTGRSRLRVEDVPAGPHLPITSLWLQRIERARARDPRLSFGERFEDALRALPEMARLDTWEKVGSDQRGARLLGDVVAQEVALIMHDDALLGTYVLIEVDAPPAVLVRLWPQCSASERRQILEAAQPHPEITHRITQSLARLWG